MGLLLNILGAIIITVITLAAITFSRAWSVKKATGKWPHEDEQANQIFRDMP